MSRQKANVVQMAESRAVYTVDEVGQLLTLGRSTAYAMVRSGQIPAVKFGNRWVIPKARFHEWLDNLTDTTETRVNEEYARLMNKEGA